MTMILKVVEGDVWGDVVSTVADETTVLDKSILSLNSNLIKARKYDIDVHKLHEFDESNYIDINKLQIIHDNMENLKERIGLCFNKKTNKREDWTGTKTIISQYLKNSKIGLKISYAPTTNNEIGRHFSKTTSLQGINRTIRHTISKEKMRDIDVVNCHPEILIQICKTYNIQCSEIEYYINNRDVCLQSLMDWSGKTRDECKTITLSLLNGGDNIEIFHSYGVVIPDSCKWIENYRNQILNIHESIVQIPDFEKNKVITLKKYNPKVFNLNGKIVNNILCMFENILVQHMINFCLINNISVIANCFDGVLITPYDHIHDFLDGMMYYVNQKTGFILKIKEKIMDEDISLDGLTINENEIVFNDSIDIKKEDDYYWVDFERKYMNTIFTDYEDLKQNIIQDLPRVLAKITLGKGFYIKKEHSEAICDIIPINDMKRIVFRYNSIFRNKKGQELTEVLTIKLDEVYTDCRLPLYSHPDMILDKSIKSNAYNIFKGIRASKIDNIDMDLINKFFTHIETIICNDNKEASHFFISWLRWIMIYPHIKTKVFVFLFSKEGYGKSTIGNFLSEFIFGHGASHISAGLDSLTGAFNKHLLGKLFCQIEELPTTSENFHKQFDNMKTLISENKMFCNPKGVEGFKINNFLNFLGCSNNKYSLRMPKTDTRYFVQEIVKKMSSDYWDDYYKNFQNQGFADMLYSYFLKTNDDDFVRFNGRPKIPMTDLKEELIQFSLPTHEKFYKDIIDGEYKLSSKIFKPEFVYNRKTYKYASSLPDLWTEYLNWGSIMCEKDLKRKYLEFKQYNNGKFRFIDLQEKITNIQELEFRKI